MNALARCGPLRDAQVSPTVRWLSLETMPTAACFDDADAQRLGQAGIGDLGFARRAGVKGPGARGWLEALGLPTPLQPNAWLRAECGSLVARLGLTEFAVVGVASSTAIAQMNATLPTAGVYPVPRFDADLLLAGRHVHDLLKQTCTFDFEGLDLDTQPLVMTSMVGVGVTVLAFAGEHGPHYRVWCDGTYGAYLWDTLTEVAAGLGGGAVGFEALGPLAH
ncbi:MAG: methylglutamate dehydrogenase [Methylibium sp.]|nr:methylglutamate dehydrogenase [Methylibium sp.]